MTFQPSYQTRGDKRIHSYWCQKNDVFSKNIDWKNKIWRNKDCQKYFEELKEGWRAETNEELILQTMQNVLKDVDDKAGFRISRKQGRFLDVGAACGGFSSYMLAHGHGGVALTLPEDFGGHKMLVEDSDNFETKYIDITQEPFDLDLGEKFDTILCDATFLGSYKNATSMKEEYDEEKWIKGQFKVMVAQIAIALKHARRGTNIVMKLTCKPQAFMMSIILLMQLLFNGKCAPIKPTVCHKVRSSFYLVCIGMVNAPGKILQELVTTFHSIDPMPVLNSIVPGIIDATTQTNMDKLAKFLEPVWKFQNMALSDKFYKICNERQEEKKKISEMKRYYGKQWREGWWY